MNDNIGLFIIFVYVIIWVFTALNYETETEEENKILAWIIAAAWPFIIVMKLIKK